MRWILLLTLICSTASALAFSQAAKTPAELDALYEKHKSDFDYLLGDWEFTAKSHDHSEYGGLWSAVRLPGGQVLDEWRALDEQGGTAYVTTTLRSYNAAQDRWELIGMESGNGLQDFGTAHQRDGEVHIEQVFGKTSSRPVLRRIRYFNIKPDSFSWTSDRSLDNGKTWEAADLQIQARRIGPPRSMDPLTKSKDAAAPGAR